MSPLPFEATWVLRGAPAQLRDQVLDLEGRRRAFVDDGARDVRVRRSREGDLEVVHSTRGVPTGARGPAAAVVGRVLEVVQTEWWGEPDPSGVVEGRIEVEFPGRPLAVSARVEVRPTATGCTEHVTGRAHARIPGAGRLVEQQIVRRTLADLARHLPLDPARR
ncbi:DUF2505 family protein [Jatrophihabitans sp. YIM 134969]